MRRLLILPVALLACSNPVFPVNMSNVEVQVTSLTQMNEKVIYTQPSTFSKPTIAFSGVTLRGNSSATVGVTPQTVKLFLYARTTDPQADATNCASSGSLTLCGTASEAKLNSVAITLPSDGTRTAFEVNDPSGALKNGINAGKLWLGIEVTEGVSFLPTITLSQAIANVTML
jgi:hypothetical protein